MKKVKVISGNFATGEGNKGNFNGYDSDGQRYFIPKRLMTNHGWDTDKAVAYPFWAKADVKSIGQLDAEGEPVMNGDAPVMVDRLQVLSIFKTREELIENEVDKASLDIEIQAGVKAKASSAGLTPANVEALLLASVS